MEQTEAYEKAGKIVWKALAEGRRMIRPGARLLDVAERVEAIIAEEGALPAFPVNISINADAAHDTPKFGDGRTFGEKDLVKLDAGAHIEGYIGDAAITIDLSGEQGALVEASAAALEAAVAAIKPGVGVVEMGGIVEEEIKKRGFRPIENLTGHQIAQYILHAGTEIPNVRRGGQDVFEEGQVYAIEPFATTGAGSVAEGSYVEIFGFEERQAVRMRESRRMMALAEHKYRTLPFAERWLRKEFDSRLLFEAALRELVLSGAFRQYPILTEVKKGLVSQAEYTVLVEHDGAKILTK
ncbi:MAG: type II methionyl aminopeptidase [Candidatus Burarchaeum sp.]|nr:type II methionyl aminopeptidase [Candidatus Burarchaeum sp.]MDO8339764.1 type II methionyl aminopeptidase [Candidatus Burarchaeum sp.]